MKCTLHIGTGKTGSTSIQELLFQNRATLHSFGAHFSQAVSTRNHGWLLAACAIVARRLPNVHIRQNILTENDRIAFLAPRQAQLHAEISQLPRSCTRFILSAEGCYTMGFTPELERLKEILAPFDSVEIIVFLRRQDYLATSQYSQVLRGGYATRDIFFRPPHFEYDGRTLPDYFDYLARLSCWAEVFGWQNIRIVPLDDVNGYDSCRLFVTALELGDAEFDIPATLNLGITATGQELIRRINSELPNIVDGTINPRRRKLIQLINKEFPGKGRRPSKAAARRFLAAYTSSNEKLSEVSGIPISSTFGTSVRDFPESETDLETLVRAASLSPALRAALLDSGIEPERILHAAARG